MMEIKKITTADLPDFAGLMEELAGEPVDFEQMTKNFAWINQNEDYYLLGAKVNGKLAGSVMGIVCRDLVKQCRPFLVIENVIVASSVRKQGVGRELMLAIEQLGRERNCYYTMFVSGAQRKAAHQFYESLGYQLDLVQGFKKYLDT